jgi:hypothetical protein
VSYSYPSIREQYQEHDVTQEVPTEKEAPKQIFITDGKNKTPLAQLKDIPTQFKVPYQVAIDEPHKVL